MTTKRVPLNRPFRQEITGRAVELFRQMEAIECTCSPRDWEGDYWRHEPCDGCERWWQLHSTLHDELRLPPWRWPAYEDPAAANPYPEGSVAAKQWAPNKDAVAMYRQLKAAARATRRRAKPARDTPSGPQEMQSRDGS